MGQAFRRASGRLRPSSSIDSTSSSSNRNNVVDRRPPAAAADKLDIMRASNREGMESDDTSRITSENVLEERDPKYDAMLNQMVGRITSKPGGKLEIGEAFVVEKYNRPMPRLRDTKPESGRYEERPAPPGTLNVAQLRHIILLHEGKADDHDGPMGIHRIAEKFQVDVAEVQRILSFLSLPPESNSIPK